MKLKELMDLFENTIFHCNEPVITWGYQVKEIKKIKVKLAEFDNYESNYSGGIRINNKFFHYYDDRHDYDNLKCEKELLDKEVKSIKTICLCPEKNEVSMCYPICFIHINVGK